MDDDALFVSALVATLIPFVTALLVRFEASSGVKATVATVLSLLDSVVVVWVKASSNDAPLEWKTFVLALAAALLTQRVVYSQVVRPYRIPEALPAGGLIG